MHVRDSKKLGIFLQEIVLHRRWCDAAEKVMFSSKSKGGHNGYGGGGGVMPPRQEVGTEGPPSSTPTSAAARLFESNPLSPKYDIGGLVGNGGPDGVWKIYKGVCKEDLKVSGFCA